jgi:SAM-dependent methyltransferase
MTPNPVNVRISTMTQQLADVWAAGDAYEPYIGRWSRVVAREFLAWLGGAIDGACVDVGCGTGALTQTVLATHERARVSAIDASTGFVSYARAHTDDPRATFTVADARALPFATESVDAAISALVLNFVPTPAAAVADMTRVVRRGGIVATYLWDYAEGMETIRRFWDAVIELHPNAAELDEARRFPLCNPTALVSLWTSAGLRSIESRAIEIPTRFANFDDYWNPFLGGQGPAPTFVKQLGETDRETLRTHLRAALPHDAGGTITLTARAWAIRGARV